MTVQGENGDTITFNEQKVPADFPGDVPLPAEGRARRARRAAPGRQAVLPARVHARVALGARDASAPTRRGSATPASPSTRPTPPAPTGSPARCRPTARAGTCSRSRRAGSGSMIVTVTERLSPTVSRVGVADVPEAEAVGRGDGGLVTVAGPQEREHVAGAALAEAGVDDRPDDRAHHAGAERAGADVVAQHAVAEVVPGRVDDPADRRLALRALLAERGEVVGADERIGRHPQRPAGRAAGHVPRVPGPERVRHRPVHDRVPVRPGRRRVAGVEPGGDEVGGADHDLGPEHRVEARLHAVDVDAGRRLERHDLAPGVHPGVGAAGAREVDLGAQHLAERVARARPATVRWSGWTAKPRKSVPSYATRNRHTAGPSSMPVRGAGRIEERHGTRGFGSVRRARYAPSAPGRPGAARA